MDIEKRAFEMLQNHYRENLGRNLPSETTEIHAEVVRILSGNQ